MVSGKGWGWGWGEGLRVKGYGLRVRVMLAHREYVVAILLLLDNGLVVADGLLELGLLQQGDVRVRVSGQGSWLGLGPE